MQVIQKIGDTSNDSGRPAICILARLAKSILNIILCFVQLFKKGLCLLTLHLSVTLLKVFYKATDFFY